jgi:hypothetical protein
MMFSGMPLFEVVMQVRVTWRPILVSPVDFLSLLKCLVCDDQLTATKLLHGIAIVNDAI